jgi:hypothetical protein
MHEEYLISLYSAKKKSIEKKVYKKFYLPKKQRFYLDFKTLSLSIALMITSIVLWNLYSKNQNYFYNINSENLQEDEDDLILDSFDEQVNTIDEIDDESDYFEKPNAVNTMQNSIVNAVKFPFPVNRDSSVLQSLKNLSAPILKTSEELNHYQSGDEFLGEAIPNNFQSQILADGFPDRISDMTKHMSLQISDSSANHQIKKDIQVEKKDGSHLNAVQIDSTEEKEEVFEPISESAPDILENSANLNVEQTDTNASSEDE